MEILLLIIGLAVGAALGYFISKAKQPSSPGNEAELSALQKELEQSRFQHSRAEEGKYLLQTTVAKNEQELKTERDEKLRLTSHLSHLKAENSNLQQRLDDQKQELQNLQQTFAKEFENLANKILDEKSRKFTEQNKENINQILKPLGEKIKEFEEKVQKNYDTENKEKASLKTEILRLYDLNQKMTTEAQNLTRALKGDNKAQGNWGEFILESILEKSGLVKNREYVVQQNFTTEDGRRLQPDVVVSLPENKTLVIDSKVSLIGYEKFCSAEDEALRVMASREHINSVRSHIKGLSDKSYQKLYQIKTLDFVLLFIPIEPAFALAVQQDMQLFQDAFDKNIVIVSPSTLLATLRTVASIWRQENHNRNALEIAQKAGDLYDKFNGFIEDMIDVGKKLDGSKKSYSDAMKKLTEG
ncbi:MAG TPA: DNA recombination protein RmuC, partial [Chitinophagaceae bacterium]|nr:DNA recombination protein RmuC [Chitinophagaceae bacterium]